MPFANSQSVPPYLCNYYIIKTDEFLELPRLVFWELAFPFAPIMGIVILSFTKMLSQYVSVLKSFRECTPRLLCYVLQNKTPTKKLTSLGQF